MLYSMLQCSNFYYAQYYAHVKDLCLTVLLEYIHLYPLMW